MTAVVQITSDTAVASGMGSFVRSLDAELKAQGVDSILVSNEQDLRAVIQNLASRAHDCVFHIHGIWLPLPRLAARLARARGIPVVWSTHGMTSSWAIRHHGWKKLPAWSLFQRRDLLRADAIHCASALEKGWNEARGLSHTFVVPMGTVLPDLSPRPVTEGHTLLFVGRLNPVKALDRLIAAFQSVPHDGWRLRLVGPDEGGYMNTLKRMSGADVEFVGPRTGAELSAEYNACDCLALVSHSENFGAAVADALACGKPVVTSTGTPWACVAEKGCGWCVENDRVSLAQALKDLMSLSDAARAEKGLRARRLAEGLLSWPTVARAFAEKYEDVLLQRKRPA